MAEGKKKLKPNPKIKKKGKVLLKWTVGKEKKETNNIFWIIGLFVLIVGVLVYSFYIQRWLTGTTFVVLILALAWYVFPQQKSVNIFLEKRGIWIEKQFYNFEKIKGYWISEANKTVYLIPKFRGAPTIAVPIGEYKANSIVSKFPSSIVRIEEEGRDVADIISGILKK